MRLPRISYNTSNRMRLSLLALPSMLRETYVAATRLAIDEKGEKILLRFRTGPY